MCDEIVGSSGALQKVLSLVSKVAPTDATVLITEQTGTGKELVARAIHRRSRRSSRAFVSVNCAAIPRDLIASELFGHEKGSFTGALHRRLGRFELAEGGTIFLDEVGELPAETQIALLRVLQEHEFERVGGTRSIQTNVRVIAATNRNLQAAIAAGTFRNDLFTGSTFSRLICLLCGNDEKTFLCWSDTSSIIARGKWERTYRGSPKKASTCFAPTPGQGTSANCRT